MEEVKKLRQKEEKEITRFIKKCEELLDCDSSLWNVHNELSKAGEKSIKILFRKEVITNVKLLLTRFRHQENIS